MSDPRIAGPLSALAVPIADAVRENRSSPAHIQANNTAYCGGLLLGVAGRVALTFGSEASSFPREYLLGYVGIVCLGFLLVICGWRGARGPRDTLAALRAVALPVGGFVAMMHFAPHLWDFYLVQLFVAAVGAGNTVRFWLAIRSPVMGNARKLVRQEIAENAIEWRAVKRRR